MDLGAPVHTPFGNVKREYLIGGAVVLAVGIYAYRKHQATAAAAAAATTTTATTAPVDTATGYPQGSPEDIAALQQQNTASLGAAGSGGGGGGGTGYVSTPQTPGYTSNGQWSQAAEDYLVSSAQADPTVVAAALGKYINGQTVTTDQQSVIQQAIAFVGYPPVSGTGGYPPSIHTAPPVVTPPPPKPVVDPVPAAPANLRVLSKTATSIELGWNTSTTGAYQYHLYQGSAVVATVFGTFSGTSGKKPNTTYGPFTVRASNRAGQLSPPSNAITVKTAAK